MLQINIINRSRHALPAYATDFSAGMDLRADLPEPLWLKPGDRSLVPTGLFIQLSKNYEAQIRPRSGLALKYGITVLNAPGTIDADYRGEIKALLINLGHETFIINDGERIAQMVVARHETVEWRVVNELQDSNRGSGGFGSTGK